MKIDTRQVAYRPAEQGAADRRNSPLSKKFSKAVCGISVVKRKITPVFTEVISLLVDLKGIEPSNLTDANRALSQLSYRPKSALFTKKSCKFWISQIFDFQGKVQQIGLENGEQKIGSDVSRYGCEPCALPAELQALIFTCSLNSSFIIADFFEK